MKKESNNKTISILSIIAILLTTSNMAKAEKQSQCFPCLHTGMIYLKLEGGAAFSTNANLDVVTGLNQATDWDIAEQGYNSDLGTSSMFGGGIGYVINPLIALEIEAAHRNSFKYEKFQTSPPPDGDKTRYFDVANTTIIANLVLSGSGLSGPFSYKSKHVVIEPFVNAGLGIGFNKVSDFHSIQAGTGIPFSLMQSHTKTSFAYQVGAGVDLRTDKNIGIGIGYRYVDAGDFESNNYIEASDLSTGGKMIPWKGDVRVNEVYLSLNYYL